MLYIKKLIRYSFNLIGLQIERKVRYNSYGLNLNIGAGNYLLTGFKSLDFYSQHYYQSRKGFDSNRINYNILLDYIPYGDETVDCIYVSHVIEHLPDWAVLKLFKESFRVIKAGGVLRISTPDSKFLFNVSQFDNDYWKWRLQSKRVSKLNASSTQNDFLIEELATPKSYYYSNNIPKQVIDSERLKGSDYLDTMDLLKKNLDFRPQFPGDHINQWDFDKVSTLGYDIGFNQCIESKFQGSVHQNLQRKDIELTAPQMSLYVDLVK